MEKGTKYLSAGILIGLIGIVALGVAIYQLQTLPHEEPEQYIKIGSIVPLTGPFSDIGWHIAHSIELSADEINDKGGVMVGDKAYKLKVIFGDSESKVEVGVAVAEKLITVDKVDVMVGNFHSSIMLATMDVYQRNKIPAICVCAGTHKIVERIAEEQMDYVFDLSPTVKEMAESACAATYHWRTPKKIAFLNENTDSGRSLTEWCRKWFEKNAPEVEVVMDEYYEAELTEFYAELEKLKNSGADAWFGEVFGAGAHAFWEQYYEIEVPIFPVDVGGAATSNQEFIDAHKDEVEGMFVLQRYWWTHVTNLTMPFYASYKGRYGLEPSPYCVQGYDGVLMVAHAIEMAGSLDKAKIRDALEDAEDVLTVWGYREFAPLEEGHAMPVELSMIQVVGGTKIPIWPLDVVQAAGTTYTPTYPPYPWD